MKNALGLTGANIAQDELGLDGSGETIAIIDSGLDYTLPEFGGCFGAGCKVRGGFDLVGDSYNATPGPAFDATPHPDGDPLPCDPDAADRAEVLGAGTSDAAHGTHVAGIAAADGRGHVDDGQVVGVAPGAKLLAYSVFGCNGGTDSDVLVHAMELALADHANVVNMSIGAAFNNWPQYPTAVAADNLVDAGVTVVTSIGNSGVNGGQLWSAGAPGVGRKVIGVRILRQPEGNPPGVPGRDPDGDVQPRGRLARDRAPRRATARSSRPAPRPRSATVASTAGCRLAAGKIALIRRGTVRLLQQGDQRAERAARSLSSSTTTRQERSARPLRRCPRVSPGQHSGRCDHAG